VEAGRQHRSSSSVWLARREQGGQDAELAWATTGSQSRPSQIAWAACTQARYSPNGEMRY
jgi:hypothetical protein